MANPKKKMEVADLAMNFVDTHGIDAMLSSRSTNRD